MQTYYAQSLFVSRVFWFNAASAIVAILQSADVIAVLPAKWVPFTTAAIAGINIVLRLYTLRPAAIIAPGESSPVSVPSI